MPLRRKKINSSKAQTRQLKLLDIIPEYRFVAVFQDYFSDLPKSWEDEEQEEMDYKVWFSRLSINGNINQW